jgi:hypothetical protein
MKCLSGIKGIVFFSITILFTLLFTANAEDSIQYLPLAKYDHLSLGAQQVNSAGGGLVIVSDEVFFAGIYTNHSLGRSPEPGYPEKYHAIELILDGSIDRHGYLAILQSVSNKPVYGGLHTFQAALAYSYELMTTDHVSLALGAGLAMSDFGLELENGEAWPILPIPLVRLSFMSRIVDLTFEFITGPNLNLVLAPDGRIRFLGDFRMDEFQNIRDLIFECALEYRLFASGHAMSDLAGISAGIKSDRLSFVPSLNDTNLDVHYYALFGRLDLSLLNLSGGYVLDSAQILRKEESLDAGSGFFITIQAVLPL